VSVQAVAARPWLGLRRGVLVRIKADGRYLGEGTVDGLSRDGSTLWVQFGGVEGRRMFQRTDDVQIGLARRAHPVR
jgi:hypothetical protein